MWDTAKSAMIGILIGCAISYAFFAILMPVYAEIFIMTVNGVPNDPR